MVERKLFSVDFEPVVQPREYVRILPEGKFFQVIGVRAVPFLQKDFGALTANVEKKDQEVEEVYTEDDEFGQWRMQVVDNFTITEHKCPRGRHYWLTKKSRGNLPQYMTYGDPMVENNQLTEFFQYKDKERLMSVLATASISTSRVNFYGYIFKMKEVEEQPAVWTDIPTEGTF